MLEEQDGRGAVRLEHLANPVYVLVVDEVHFVTDDAIDGTVRVGLGGLQEGHFAIGVLAHGQEIDEADGAALDEVRERGKHLTPGVDRPGT